VLLPQTALIAAVLAAALPFGHGLGHPHPTEIAPYRFENTILRLRFDLADGELFGHETAVVRPKQDGTRTLPFDAVGLQIHALTVNGQRATYTADAVRQRINVQLAAPAAENARIVVDFTYTARPQRGLYFILPNRAYPAITPEIWTQGEPTDNRRWFPTWDEPNEKTPSELIVTVPRGWTVIGNGYLRAHTATSQTETWDWNAPRPKAPYLIAFAAGPLVRNHTTLASLDVDSYVQPADAALNALCFGATKDMVAFYARLTGVPFPWDKEDQMTAERFFFGGMEDASATIQTALALHPASEEPEQSCDLLVSHELVQQWFGDDASFSDWSNAWLGEGFATYFEELWSEHRFGEAHFEYERYRAQQTYFAETERYARPIVDNAYSDPIEVFDASSHERAGQALHMLRAMYGDRRFFGALGDYLRRYQERNADTAQFFASIGASLGADLTWFEREWFYRSGYPHYVVADRYDAAAQTLTTDIRQRNDDGAPYRMPVVIEAFANGHAYRITSWISRNAQTVVLRGIPSKPQMVLFDPNNTILRELIFPKPVDELAYQLAHAAHVGDREWALHQLAAQHAAQPVARAVRTDAFYGMRADAVTVAGGLNDASSVDAGMHDSDKRVRIAAAIAASSLTSPAPAVVADLEAAANDTDPIVIAAALQSLGALHAPHAYATLVAALHRPSFHQAIAAGALRGLGALGDERALALLETRTAYGTQDQERSAAIAALAQLALRTHLQSRALPILRSIALHDPLPTSRDTAIKALGALGDAEAIPTLEQAARDDSQTILRLDALDAASTLLSLGARPCRQTSCSPGP
jgi:aminopeptidase N